MMHTKVYDTDRIGLTRKASAATAAAHNSTRAFLQHSTTKGDIGGNVPRVGKQLHHHTYHSSNPTFHNKGKI